MPYGPIKTYKEVIEFFETLCSQHLAVKQFFHGTISDIDVQVESLPVTQYPLVFMVHDGGSIHRDGLITFDFDLMVMDIAKDRADREVNVLTETHSILMDILSKILLTNWEEIDMDIETPIQVQSFVERFNNRLSGWTAGITIELRVPLNLCYAAFE